MAKKTEENSRNAQSASAAGGAEGANAEKSRPAPVRGSSGPSAGPPAAQASANSPSLPDGVRFVTITIPVWSGPVTGYTGSRHIDANVSQPAAEVINRIRIAHEKILEAALAAHGHAGEHLHGSKREVSAAEAVKTVFHRAAEALAKN